MDQEEPEPWVDPVVEAYKRDIDRTLLRENLKLTPDQRLRKLQALQRWAEELRRAGRSLRGDCSPGTAPNVASVPDVVAPSSFYPEQDHPKEPPGG